MQKLTYQIRPVVPQDLKSLIQLCKAHAKYEKVMYYEKAKEQLLSRQLFDTSDGLKCMVVEQDGMLIGYTTFIKQYSTWMADYYVYLDCLFLKESVRGHGIGQQIMNRIRAFAKQENCNWMEWQTPAFNESAIRFYRKLGAQSKQKERFIYNL